MGEVCQIPDQTATPEPTRSRVQIAAKVISFEDAKRRLGLSQRQAADSVDVPRTTILGWLERKETIDAPETLVRFFESPDGVLFLHRLVLAAQVVITLMGPGSIRMVCAFLLLSGLHRFVASSYGSQQQAIAAIEQTLCAFGASEFRRLAQQMQPKRITLIEDETFHPQICLVAMEAASGFILLELYAEDRSSKTWTQKVKEALEGLPVEIVQVTSDEARGLLGHAGKGLEVHHSPDLFHPQQDLVRATSRTLGQRVEAARGAVTEAEDFTKRLQENTEVYKASEDKTPWCSLEAMERNIGLAKEAEVQARERLGEAEEQQAALGEARRAISACYHPFDLETGQARSAEQVERDLEEHFDEIDEIACFAEVSQRAHELIAKARRVVPLMVATITFFHERVRGWVGELGLTESLERFVLQQWIAGRYLELVAARAQDAAARCRLRQAAAKLMPSKEQIASMLSGVSDQDRLLIAFVVEQCAQLFQRSSSGVEGRNGHLSLFHHGHHRLLARKLEALTVVHNFMKVRPDGTTAAERFFGLEPRDAFEYLVEQMPLPARPSKSRRKAAS
jgi:hypothetical protein